MSEVIAIDPLAPDRTLLARATAVLQRGGLVAFPTETVYGLGANALDATAVARIFAAKGRPATNPLIVHVADTADLGQVVSSFPDVALRLAMRFWPGPLTLVLPKQPCIPDLVTAGLATVGVRVPAHPVARQLIEAAGFPLAAPSANRSMRVSPTRAEHVRELPGVELILDAGPTSGGLESTVLDVTQNPPRLLRPGLVTPAQIEALIGPIQREATATKEGTSLPSPGMMTRHYAPRAVLETTLEGWLVVASYLEDGVPVGWLTFAEPAEVPAGLTLEVMPRDPGAYAARLYAVLHALDDAGVERIIVDLPPDGDDWLAVRDRLKRAAAR